MASGFQCTQDIFGNFNRDFDLFDLFDLLAYYFDNEGDRVETLDDFNSINSLWKKLNESMHSFNQLESLDEDNDGARFRDAVQANITNIILQEFSQGLSCEAINNNMLNFNFSIDTEFNSQALDDLHFTQNTSPLYLDLEDFNLDAIEINGARIIGSIFTQLQSLVFNHHYTINQILTEDSDLEMFNELAKDMNAHGCCYGGV